MNGSFLRNGSMSPSNHRKFDGAGQRQRHEISSDEFVRRMTTYLKSMPLPPAAKAPSKLVPDLIAPLSVRALRETGQWDMLMQREPSNLPGFPAIAYSVRAWRDISWTASGTVGFRTALPEHVAAGITPQAVIVRARSAADATRLSLLFMLWANESAKGGGWRLWGVEPIPVN